MKKNKVCGVYKIENTVTGDFYIGSSRNIKNRWLSHKRPSAWKQQPNSSMYKDMKKYGVENFQLTILCDVEPEQLTDMEQKMIEELHPTYNKQNAKGWDVERHKESQKKANRKYQKKYYSQLCSYNGETLTLGALNTRFRRAGIGHPALEAKKYLIEK